MAGPSEAAAASGAEQRLQHLQGIKAPQLGGVQAGAPRAARVGGVPIQQAEVTSWPHCERDWVSWVRTGPRQEDLKPVA